MAVSIVPQQSLIAPPPPRPILGTAAPPAPSSPWSRAAASPASSTSRPPPAAHVAGFRFRGRCRHVTQTEPLFCSDLPLLSTARTPSGSRRTRTHVGRRRGVPASGLVSAADAPAQRQVSGLTDRGLAVALTVRLRNAAEQLDEVTRQRLLGDLRALVDEYAPHRSDPAA